jgi:hypothetical protein
MRNFHQKEMERGHLHLAHTCPGGRRQGVQVLTRKARTKFCVYPRSPRPISFPPSSFLLPLSSFLFLLSSFLLSPSSFVSAQTAAYAEIGAPDATKFPIITAVLDVYDANGQFVSGLKPEDVVMLEDGNQRQVQELTEFPVGAQIVVGVNPGPSFDVRDGSGVTRYQKLQQAFGIWSQSLAPETGDNLSLVTIAGPVIAHTDPASWLASLAAFQPNFRATTPNIQSLAMSVEAALAPTPQVGMKRAVLFLTPHMEALGLEATLAEIGQRAVAGRVRVFVWLVDSELNFNHPSAALFQAFAAQTGGDFAAFDGSNELPDPETYFAPLRAAYQLTYASALRTAGEHNLSAEVTIGETRVATAAQTLTLNIQPPNPILSAPPEQVTRRPPEDDPYNRDNLLPTEQPLTVIFDFPDGHPRAITSVVLYVDGQAVAKNTTGAIDQFNWDLSAYAESGRHTLKVEATDNLGLTGSSLEIPVDVQVVVPTRTPLAFFNENRYLIVGAVVGVAGVILLGTLLSGRVRFRSPRARRAEQKRLTDPVTQPVVIAAVEPRTSPMKTARRTRPAKLPDAPARLTRLAPDGQPAPGAPIPLSGSEARIGANPVQADIILDEPALAPLHARIQKYETGYLIFDMDSVAGTWVNYEIVTREGHPLKHGDRVHLGNLLYRFELKDPPPTPEPTVSPADP